MVILGGDYVKTDEVSEGDVIAFLDEGDWVKSARFTYEDGNAKQDFVMRVRWRDMEKSMRINKTNRDAMVVAYGANTAEWVGKMAQITKEKVMVGGKKMDTIVLAACEGDGKFQGTGGDCNAVDNAEVTPF